MIHELANAIIGETWAIRQDSLSWLWGVACGDSLAAQPDDRKPRKLPKVDGAVVVLPLHGMISQRASVWQDWFGGTATESFGAAFTRAINHPKVGAVLIDVDSPGGTVNGVPELSDTISRGAQIKPVAAIANSQMASAAYWLGSQVGPGKKRLTAAPSADVGSIGVFRMHEDVSEMLAADGVKVTFLAMPEFKTEANPFEPLTDAAIEHHMGQVEATYDQFVSAVASGRGVLKSAVKERFGKGRMFHASQAADMGLVDRVASLPQMLAEFGGTLNQLEHAEADVLRDEICHAWECGQMEAITSGDVLLQRQKLRLKQKT